MEVITPKGKTMASILKEPEIENEQKKRGKEERCLGRNKGSWSWKKKS